MARSRLGSTRATAVALGGVAGLLAVAGLAAGGVEPAGGEPALFAASVASVAIGVAGVAATGAFLLLEQSLVTPAVAGVGFAAVALAGLGLAGGPAAEQFLTKWPWAAAAVLGGGAAEYGVRRAIEAATGRFGPRPLA